MPAMKLERIKAADQIELPKLKPLSRSQRVSKMSALMPDRNRIPERIATRIFVVLFVILLMYIEVRRITNASIQQVRLRMTASTF